MWIQNGYTEVKKFDRAGILSSLILPKDSKKDNNLYKLAIKSKNLELVKGSDTYILSNEIGIQDTADFTFFFLNDLLCVKLEKGSLFVKDTDGEIYSINNKHKMTKLTIKEDKLIWKSLNDFIDLTNCMIKDKYNVYSPIELSNYRNNLIFSVRSSYSVTQSCLFTIKFLNISEKIGGSFEFKVYEGRKPINTDHFEIPDEMSANSKAYNKSYSSEGVENEDDDDDADDVNAIINNIHEVDIFSEWND